jgi:hypothetical protein
MLFNAVVAAVVALHGDHVFLQKELQKDTADPVTIVHEKEPGNGYAEGDTYNPNNPEEPLTSGSTTVASGEVPPVSTTMKCVINLSIQYFLVYTALAIARSYVEFSGPAPRLTSTLVAATGSVAYAPMLSVLFLGVRMRALQLSQGKPDDYDLPQPWVKNAMQSCAWAVLIQTVMVLALPLVLNQTPTVSEDGSPEVKTEGGGMMATVFSVIRWVAMLMLYGGFTTVVVGGIVMEAPKEIWGDDTPPVSPAVDNTMQLAAMYFLVYLAIALLQTYETFSKESSAGLKKWIGIWQLATNTVNFAPMLSVLFIGARMRALQLDPKHGNPQTWAQNCFYMCTYSLAVQLALVIIVPGLLGGRCVRGDSEGDISFEIQGSPNVFWVLSVLRYVLMAALYGGFTAVIVSVNLIEAPGGEPTPPVSPAMQCVMNLTVQYFFVYLFLWVLLTLKQLSITSLRPFLTTMIPTLEAAKGSVMFCPMLAVLFVGLRLRALQITEQKGAPQGWAQQAMFAATYAVLAQVLLILMMPIFMGAPPKVDADGNVIANKEGSPVMGYVLTAFRYLALIGVYGGAVTVVVALFKITPETATGSGSLIPGVDIPTPPPIPGQAGSF